MTALSVVLASLLSYLTGAIPFGYLIARWRGVDILKQGSGNIGATNVGRVLGRPFGILVFLLDFAKGAVPALLAKGWVATHELELPADSLPVAAAVAAFLGHLYPIYLRFRGGKGVATATGAVSVLLPGPALAALLIWLAVVLASRYVSLASLSAAATLCVVRLAFTPQPWSEDQRILTLFCLIAAALIFVRHHANIGRLLHGDENRLKETPGMLHFSKILHVLALGLWFGTVIFFSFVVGLNLFGTFERVAEKEPEEREVWFPMWKAYDRKALDSPSFGQSFVESVRKEQGTRAAGVAIKPLFYWYFSIQSVCALLAAATALSWRRMSAGRVHTVRIRVLLAALVTVALGCWLLRVVEDKRDVRTYSFDAMVRHLPQRSENDSAFGWDVSAFYKARQSFALWHLASLGVNMMTVVLVTISMAQAVYLPVIVPEEKKIV